MEGVDLEGASVVIFGPVEVVANMCEAAEIANDFRVIGPKNQQAIMADLRFLNLFQFDQQGEEGLQEIDIAWRDLKSAGIGGAGALRVTHLGAQETQVL